MNEQRLVDVGLLEVLHSILTVGPADEDVITDAADKLRAALASEKENERG